MPSIVADLADALALAIGSQVFSREITVARKCVPAEDLRDLDGIQVTIVPRGVAIANAARSRLSHEITVDIAIQRKLPGVLPVDVDPMMDLTQELVDYVTRLRLADLPELSWLRVANTPIWAADHLQSKRLFTSVITVTYLTHR